MLNRVTGFSSSPKGKWIVIAVWLILAFGIVPLAPSLADVVNNDSSTFLPEGAESTQVEELVKARFASDSTPAIVVFHNPDGLTDEQKAVADDLGKWAQSDQSPENIDANGVVSIFTTPQAAGNLVSDDGTTMTMVIGVTGDPTSDAYQDAVRAIREQVDNPPAGVEIDVSGPGGLLLDLLAVFQQIDVFLTLVTAALVLVLLIAIYRSPVIAFVPLLAVGWVFTLTGAIAAAAAEEFGIAINGQAQGIATVLLFGAGTDYCLFIASRYREELRRIEDKHEAMRVTMRAVGGAIASSAATVLVATFILTFAILRSTSALGPLLSIAIGTMLVAGVTLVPALITTLGRAAFWPARLAYDPDAASDKDDKGPGFWERVAGLVTRRPAVSLATSVAVFALFSLGLLEYRVTYDSITSLPEGTEARQGFEYLRESFPAGESAPIEVYVALDDDSSVYENLGAIDTMTRLLNEYKGVALVESATSPLGTDGPVGVDQVEAAVGQLPEQVRSAIDEGSSQGSGGDAAGDPELAEAMGVYGSIRAFISPDNAVARFDVILEDSPYAIQQIEEIGAFRTYARNAANEAGLDGEVLVGGETATNYDTKQANDRDVRIIIPFILVTIGIILGILLRSVVAPLYLLGTIVLGYAGTLGLSTALFEYVFGYDGVGSAIPLYLFVFSAALGIDYSIYLMTRIREETLKREFDEGVRMALSRTGGVITSAGIILAGTFSALMILPLRDLFQLGLAVAIGVLLDTFVVRTVMVPGIVLLLGRWNWWPSKRSREVLEPSQVPSAVEVRARS